jgi:hypothetical protein
MLLAYIYRSITHRVHFLDKASRDLFICAKYLFTEATVVIGEGWAMSLYWLCYRHNNQISVVIEPGASLIHARMRAALANLDEGAFTEGHELVRKWRVPKEKVGRRLSQKEAKRYRMEPMLQLGSI